MASETKEAGTGSQDMGEMVSIRTGGTTAEDTKSGYRDVNSGKNKNGVNRNPLPGGEETGQAAPAATHPQRRMKAGNVRISERKGSGVDAIKKRRNGNV